MSGDVSARCFLRCIMYRYMRRLREKATFAPSRKLSQVFVDKDLDDMNHPRHLHHLDIWFHLDIHVCIYNIVNICTTSFGIHTQKLSLPMHRNSSISRSSSSFTSSKFHEPFLFFFFLSVGLDSITIRRFFSEARGSRVWHVGRCMSMSAMVDSES
jgi:hypothetical protein